MGGRGSRGRGPEGDRASLAWLWALVAGAALTQTALNLARPVTSYRLLALDAPAAAANTAVITVPSWPEVTPSRSMITVEDAEIP